MKQRKIITLGISLSLILVLSVFSFLAYGATPHVPIKGTFSVDGKGTSNYSIPIDIVPAKYQPHIGLSYNSQGGSGLIGHGWSLQGAEAINICSMNKRQDNNWANITLNMGVDDYSTNRFCLGSKRLAVIGGKYGADGSTYQTELFSQKIITAVGKCGDGPCSFTVQSGDGSVQSYGGDSNSTVQLEDKDILSWGIQSDVDKFGNKIEFTYLASDKSNILYPSEIDYFFTKDDSRKVLFDYNSREDTNRQNKLIGLGGYAFQPDMVLTTITTHDSGDLGVMVYTFNTEYDKFIDGYRLTSLDKESFDKTESYYTHKFSYKDYQPDIPEFKPVNTVNLSATVTDWESVKVVVMDKYGDGYNGVGIISNENNHAMFSFARGDKDGFLTVASDDMDLGEFTATDTNEDAYTFLSFDKNGNGLNDLVKIYKGEDGQAYAQTYLSQAGKPNFIKDPIVQPFNSPYQVDADNKTHYVGRDINGDGLVDIVEMKPTTNEQIAKYTITVFYGAIAGGFPTHDIINDQIQSDIIPTVTDSVTFSDYDKDTLSDFFLLTSSNRNITATPLYNRLGKFLAPDGTTSQFINLGDAGDWKGLPAYNFVDFNSDGLTDLVKFDFTDTLPVTGNIYMNTGNLFGDMLDGSGIRKNTTEIFTLTDAGEDENNAHNVTFADINGDGQPDILKYNGGNKDPEYADNTYFDTFIHTGNSFVKGQPTVTFGTHTRTIVSSMGDNPLASIISIRQLSSGVNITVHANNIKPPVLELVGIDNGIGLTYGINYEKVSPFIDYVNMKQPAYPNILMSKVRMVVSSYTKTQDADKSYGFSRIHDYEYKFPVYNKHDWMFSGYRTVTESIKSLDKITTRNYYTTYPIRGNVKSVTIGQLSTGNPFSEKSTTWGFTAKYPKASPAVNMVYKTGTSDITYQDDGLKVAYEKVKTFSYDSVWGVPLSSAESFTGGDSLYRCNRFVNGSKTPFIVGVPSGKLYTKSKDQCTAFAGNFTYDTPFKVAKDDLSLKLNRLSTDGLLTVDAKLRYSDTNAKFITNQLVYDSFGDVITSTTSSDYTAIDGVFPSKDNLRVISSEYGPDGYVFSRSENSFTTLTKTDSRFGVAYEKTYPSGAVETNKLNSLGFKVSKTVENNLINEWLYGEDSFGRFKEQDTYIAGKKTWNKIYLNAESKPWKHVKLINATQELTQEEAVVDSDTGLIKSKIAPYFDIKTAKSTIISYDKRWIKNKEVRDDQINDTDTSYTAGLATITYRGNDPTHASKGLVELNTVSHNPITRTTITTAPDKSTATIVKDLLGNIIMETDNRDFVSTRTFDMSGKMVASLTPDSGIETFKWDASGNLINHTTGIEINNYSYNRDKKLTNHTRLEGKLKRSIDYGWDKKTDKLISVSDGDVSTGITYDIIGNIIGKTWAIQKQTFAFKYSFYPGSHPLQVTYPDASVLNYFYSDSGEPSGQKYAPESGKPFDIRATLAFSDYGINSQPKTIKYGKNIILIKTVDGWGRALKSVFEKDTVPLSTVSYEWDNTGAIISQTRDTNKTAYTFDSRQRLINTKGNNLDLSYKYDANNNLLQNGANTLVVEDKTNRLATGVIAGKAVTFKYDTLGRLLGDGTETYTYGTSGRLEAITTANGIIPFTYFNGKKLADNAAVYLDSGYEIRTKGVAKRIKALKQTWLSINSDGKIDYIFPDRLHSNLLTIDADTALTTSAFEFEPYGAAHEIK